MRDTPLGEGGVSRKYISGFEVSQAVPVRPSNKGYEYKKKKIRGFSPRANYTDRTTTSYRQSQCKIFRIEGAS
jgi:hypothetical protein